MMKKLLPLWTALQLCLLATLLSSAKANAQQPDPEWLRDPAIVDAIRSIPIQEDGRIKPLDTHARFLLLRLHGKQSIKVSDPDNPDAGHPLLPGVKKLDATQWLLLTWFRPDIARELPLFVVDNSQAVGEVDIEPKELRDRYSWTELNPAKEKLIERARSHSEIDSKQRTAIQSQVIGLARNFFDYDAVLDYLVAAREDWRELTLEHLPESVKAELPESGPLSVWQIAAPLGKFIRENGNTALSPEASNQLLSTMIDKMVRPGMTIAIVPPADKEEVAWTKLGDLVTDQMKLESLDPADLKIGTGRDAMVQAAAQGQEAFRTAVLSWVQSIRDAAQARGELTSVDREVTYYKKDYFTNALVMYLLGFILAMIGVATLGTRMAKIISKISMLILAGGLYFNIWGIVQRCIITERPPIATLYETIIFIAACCALVALLLEFIARNNVANAVTGFLGALGMFLSMRFMALDGQDTMPTLQAVLITNFWLATHVTSINVGYAGCLLASFLSMVYMIYRVFYRGAKAPEFQRLLTRITYGVVCFGLLFSLVGTVLGGIWANDSWGRFWGWDPKENGALMIVLMGLIILHARLGGYIREMGLHQLSIFMGAVTIFSWFGTNQLGVGLHSYGFTDGIWRALITSWSIQGAFMLLGGLIWARAKWGTPPPSPLQAEKAQAKS